jgi:hypothetical protein
MFPKGPAAPLLACAVAAATSACGTTSAGSSSSYDVALSPEALEPEGCPALDATTRAGCPARLDDDPAAPVVVLYEHYPLAVSVNFPGEIPTFALFANGDTVFVHEDAGRGEVWQGHIDSAEATRMWHAAAERMRGMQRFCDSSVVDHAPDVELLVRDGDVWRDSYVHGVDRPEPGADSPSNLAPRGFLELYARLLAMRPAQGSPFQPVDLEIQCDSAGGHDDAVPWPADIPAPPTDWKPLPFEKPHMHHFSVDIRYRDALLRLMRTAEHEGKRIGFNGYDWIVYPQLRYCGEGTIDRARHRCGNWGMPRSLVEED